MTLEAAQGRRMILQAIPSLRLSSRRGQLIPSKSQLALFWHPARGPQLRGMPFNRSYLPPLHCDPRERPFDYEQRFPEDKRYEELGRFARVWRTYLEECGAFDIEMLEGWRDGLDVLLVS